MENPALGGGSIWDSDGGGAGIFSSVNPVDEILMLGGDSDETVLAKLLDESELLQEVKGQNQKLLEFLCKEDILRALIGLTQKVQDHDSVTGLERVPYIACEIFCCKADQVVDALWSNSSLLHDLFSVLDWPAPLDERVAGFFYKILAVLLQRNPELMLRLSLTLIPSPSPSEDDPSLQREGVAQGIGWLLPKLLRHLDCYSIALCVQAFLHTASESCCRGYESGENANGNADRLREDVDPVVQHAHAVWLGGCGAAVAVLEALSESKNSDAHSNAAEILINMVQRAAFGRLGVQAESTAEKMGLPQFNGMILVRPGSGENAKIAMMETGVDWTEKLCENLLELALQPMQGKEDFYVSIAAIQVLTQLVNAFALVRWAKPISDDSSSTITIATSVELNPETPKEIKQIMRSLQPLTDMLDQAPPDGLLRTQYGKEVERLGLLRLRVVELICMLIHSKFPQVIEEIATSPSDPFLKCLQLFFRFEWMNLLHLNVQHTIEFILDGNVGMTSCTSEASKAPNTSSGSASNESEELIRERMYAKKTLLPLQSALFGRMELLKLLLDAYEVNGEAITETGKFWDWLDKQRKKAQSVDSAPSPRSGGNDESSLRRHGQKGYMGCCHAIANSICRAADMEAEELGKLRQNNEASLEGFPILAATAEASSWKELVNGELADINVVEQYMLGGYRPETSNLDKGTGLPLGEDSSATDTQGFAAVDEFDQPGAIEGTSTNRLDSAGGDFADFHPFGDDDDGEDGDFGYEFQQETEQENVLYTVRVEPRKSLQQRALHENDDDDGDPFDELVSERHKKVNVDSNDAAGSATNHSSSTDAAGTAPAQEEQWVASFEQEEDDSPGGYGDFAPFGVETDDIVNVLPSENSPSVYQAPVVHEALAGGNDPGCSQNEETKTRKDASEASDNAQGSQFTAGDDNEAG